MDDIDRASQYEEQQRQAAIAVITAHHPPSPQTQYCLDCGDEIPVARRQANPHAKRCIDCQTKYEKR